MKDILFNLNKVNTTKSKNKIIQRLKYRQKTTNVIDFVVAKFKIYYDLSSYIFVIQNRRIRLFSF